MTYNVAGNPSGRTHKRFCYGPLQSLSGRSGLRESRNLKLRCRADGKSARAASNRRFDRK